MTETPKRVWVNPDVEYAEREKQYGCNIEYHRADLSADLVRAAYRAGLEAAAQYVEHQSDAKTIRTLSPVQETVAAIVEQVMKKDHV